MSVLVWWLGMCCAALALARLREREGFAAAPWVSVALVVLWPVGLPLLAGVIAYGRVPPGEDALP